jgi:glyoxylate reductase
MDHATVMITSRAPEHVIRALEEHGRVLVGENPARGMPRAEVLARVHEVDAIINQNELRIDDELLAQAPRLKIVANTAAGFDNMDVPAMLRRGVWGTNCPNSYSEDTATHTIALLLALARRLIEADAYVRSGRWKSDGWMPGGRWDGMSLSGKCMGLIGYGSIGRAVARRAEAFGMTVRHFTRSRGADPSWRPFDELIRTSDVISLHCPLTPQTRHLIDARAFAAMKPGAILLNVSRGPVVKNDDLLAALRTGILAGAGLDVFEFEPDVPAELASMPNVLLSPHMGGCTAEAREDAWRVCVGNVLNVLQGRAPDTPAFTMDRAEGEPDTGRLRA